MIMTIVICLILILMFILGYKRGFIKSVFDLFSVFLSWILAWLLYPTISSFLVKTPLFEIVKDYIRKNLSIGAEASAQTLSSYISNLPEFLNKSLMSTAADASVEILNSMENTLAVLAVNIISIIVIFIAVRIFMFIMKVFSEKINDIILIGSINKFLGGVLGLIQGILIVYLIVFAITFFPSSKVYSYVASEIETSYVCGKMFNEEVKILGIKPTYPTRKAELQYEN